jgi:hypothetical protein
MERISSRKYWLLSIILIGGVSVWLGKVWLFADAACPRLQDLLLISSAIVGTFFALIYVLITRNDALYNKFVTVGVQLGGILIIASIAGAFLVSSPQVRAIYCPSICEKADLARALRETGKLDGAEDVSRTCKESIFQDIVQGECSSECSRELSLVLFEKAGTIITIIDSIYGSEEKRSYCETAKDQLNEAHELAKKYKYSDLVSSIEERQKRLEERCILLPSVTPTPTPTSTPTPTATPEPVYQVDIIRWQKGADHGLIDVRVIKDDKFVRGLHKSAFGLKSDNNTVLFDIDDRTADDPICMITVVDNSGSIYPGLEHIRAAISKLNDLRKPDDQLGLVLFAGRDQVEIKQYPSQNPLDPYVVQGTGPLTALWDGILEGLVAAKSCSSDIDYRYLLVLTDGQDNDSRHLEGDNNTKARVIARQASEQGVDICTVGVTDEIDVESLTLVANGCQFSYAKDFDELASLFQSLFGFVRDFYRITFSIEYLPSGGLLELMVKHGPEVKIDFNAP